MVTGRAGRRADPDLLRIHDFVDLVGTAARSPRQRERMLRAAGAPITGASLTILQWVARHGPSAPTDLARSLELDQSTVSRQIRPLEDGGLVSRAADGSDRRVSRVEVTPAGQHLLDAVRDVGLHDLDVALDGFTDDERHQLADLLERMRAGMLAARLDPSGRSVPGPPPDSPGSPEPPGQPAAPAQPSARTPAGPPTRPGRR